MGQTGYISVQVGLLLVPILALIALPLAILIALALIRLFRRRVAISMRAVAGVPQHPGPVAGGGSGGVLDIEVIETKSAEERVPPLLGDARRRSRELAAIHAEAACVYPLVFVFMWWTPLESILRAATFFGIFILVFATPVVFAGMMVFTKQPGLLALAACVLVAVLWAFDVAIDNGVWLVLYVGAGVPFVVVLMLMMLRREPRIVILMTLAIIILLLISIPVWERGIKPGADFVAVWFIVAGVPTAAVVLLNTRRLRTVGPIVFAATLLLLYGIVAGAVYASFFLADAVDVRLVREDLAQRPLLDALLSFSLPESLAMLQAARSDFGSVFRYDVEKVTLWLELLLWGIIVGASVLGALAAWVVVRWLANNYRRRRASDQMLTIDVMMIIFVLPLFGILTMGENQLHGWVLGAVGLASFAGYKFWTRWRLRAWRQKKPPASPRALLLLRVFGFDRRTQRLLEDVGGRWRYLGPIRLIGGPDLAYSTLEPHEFFDFLNGRLSRAFVKDREGLEGRLADVSVVPDPDGLYRVEEFFCHDHTWRMTVSRLAKDSDAILMDLRGFTPANQGCIFEIEQLAAGVPLDRVVLLADASTDMAFLETALRHAWRAMLGDSPNAGLGRHRVRILKAGSRHRRTLKVLLGLLCEGFPENVVASPSTPASCATALSLPNICP